MKKLLRSLCTVLLSVAGAIIGPVLGGPLMAIPGLLIGFIAGQILEKRPLKLKPKKRRKSLMG